jgi:hypothetical protein
MGLIRDNEDNTEEEALTFFFEGSKKLNEFVNNKDKSNPVSSDSLDIEGVTNKNSVSEKEILKQVQEDKSNVTSTGFNINAGSSAVENSAVNPDAHAGSSGVENSAANSSSSSDSSTAL